MRIVNIQQARPQLSRLIERVSAGEEIVIAKGGKPVARLQPLVKRSKPSEPGALKGKIRIAGEFDAPLPEELLELFEGKGERRPRPGRRPATSA